MSRPPVAFGRPIDRNAVSDDVCRVSEETKLGRCYERLVRSIGGGNGQDFKPEPYTTIDAVQAHRNFWKPQGKLRVLLLAESHVYTGESPLPRMRGCDGIDLPGAPREFVRLVYCLGYGEPEYVGKQVDGNHGTWQFWQILASCANQDAPEVFAGKLRSGEVFRPVLKTLNTDFASRIRAKVGVLRALQERGIWLVDSSVLALYTSGGKKPPHSKRREIMQKSWDYCLVRQFQNIPDFTIVIGKGVAGALEGRLETLTRGRHCVLPQPQARQTSEELQRAFRTYHQVCWKYAAL